MNEPAKKELEDKRLKRFARVPVKVNYQHGTMIFCSAKETLVCDTFIETKGNLKECSERAVAAFGGKLSPKGIKKWLQIKPHMMEYLNKRWGQTADWNMSQEEYFARIRRYAEGVDKADKSQQFFWKLLGEAKGWLKVGGSGSQNTTNLQINMLQANGQQ